MACEQGRGQEYNRGEGGDRRTSGTLQEVQNRERAQGGYETINKIAIIFDELI